MPVGTQATIKTLSNQEIDEISSGIILANTYHLFLEPGLEVLSLYKGVKNFMGYHKPMLTDSGGFQVFSLSKIRDINEEGVNFKHYKNGSNLFMSPEISIKAQEIIGADIIMSFDECPNPYLSKTLMENSINRTTRWAKRGLLAKTSDQAIFGIVQGGIYKDLREKHARDLMELPFDGFSIGGLAVGEKKEEMYEITRLLDDILPRDKPRYLMGVGTVDDFLTNICNGVDMFDCVNPSRIARHGSVLTKNGSINIKNAKYKTDTTLLDEYSNNSLSNYTKGYVRHLFKNEEMLGSRIMTLQNLSFMKNLTLEVQNAIKEDRLLDLINHYKNNTNYFDK
jgi:queuine tRNA-ribosyltransferase